ncbi:acetaldehyde dehydrogenase [Rhizobium sp. AAP43]|nr:acetaldehyde dehydrogenase [Rhizobium sp. AAP43]
MTINPNPGEPWVIATDAALTFLAEIRKDHPDILFHQSGGCCDGSSPMCYPASDYRVGETDVQLGEIGGVPFYISGSQYDVWKHTQLIIDVVPGRGGMFSLDNGRERRFLTRSRLFSGGEACPLPPR